MSEHKHVFDRYHPNPSGSEALVGCPCGVTRSATYFLSERPIEAIEVHALALHEKDAEIARLREQIKAMQETTTADLASLPGLREENERLKSVATISADGHVVTPDGKVECPLESRLAQAFAFARHKDGCRALLFSVDPKCTCGLDALRALEGPK